MSEVKQFHLREGTLVEGKSLGFLNVYLAADYDQLKAENERLASAIRYEQHLADRIGTHGPDCWSWGNAHYECLKRKHQQDIGESILERDTLRKQLDEARDLIATLRGHIEAITAEVIK